MENLRKKESFPKHALHSNFSSSALLFSQTRRRWLIERETEEVSIGKVGNFEGQAQGFGDIRGYGFPLASTVLA